VNTTLLVRVLHCVHALSRSSGGEGGCGTWGSASRSVERMKKWPWKAEMRRPLEQRMRITASQPVVRVRLCRTCGPAAPRLARLSRHDPAFAGVLAPCERPGSRARPPAPRRPDQAPLDRHSITCTLQQAALLI